MIDLLPVRIDEQMLLRYEALFAACFAPSPKFSPATLKWLYGENPDGQVVGFDAMDGDELAAHYVCIPSVARIGGVEVRTLLSLNTATHPKYQGRGLFTQLAEKTYQTATEQGFHAVYGVANANSTPGFVRKLGFQLVQPLEAKVGLGGLGIDFAAVRRSAQFERVWTAASLDWRSRNPCNPVRRGAIAAQRAAFHAKAFGSLLPAYAELPPEPSAPDLRRVAASPLRLFLGLVPEGAGGFGGYVDIPRRFRPSPLNLIYRSLAHPGTQLEAGRVLFSFLDFDAY